MEQKIEYADFSDMGKTSLPDTIEEIPMENQNLAISYTDEESLKQGGQSQEPPKEELTQEEKSAAYWQSKHDKDLAQKDRELQELKNQQQQYSKGYQDLQREIQQLRGELTPKPKEEILVKPQRPNSDDPLDLIKWQSEMFDYNDKLNAKRESEYRRLEQQLLETENRRVQQERYAQEKAYHIGQLQSTGLSLEEAQEAFVMYAKAQEEPQNYYKDLGDYYRFKKGQYNSPKGDKMSQRVTRQGEVPSLANVTSETETQKKDEAGEFFGDLKKFEKRYY